MSSSSAFSSTSSKARQVLELSPAESDDYYFDDDDDAVIETIFNAEVHGDAMFDEDIDDIIGHDVASPPAEDTAIPIQRRGNVKFNSDSTVTCSASKLTTTQFQNLSSCFPSSTTSINSKSGRFTIAFSTSMIFLLIGVVSFVQQQNKREVVLAESSSSVSTDNVSKRYYDYRGRSYSASTGSQKITKVNDNKNHISPKVRSSRILSETIEEEAAHTGDSHESDDPSVVSSTASVEIDASGEIENAHVKVARKRESFSYRKRSKFYTFDQSDELIQHGDGDDGTIQDEYDRTGKKRPSQLSSIYVHHSNQNRESELGENDDENITSRQDEQQEQAQQAAIAPRRKLPSETGMEIKANEYGDNITPWRDKTLGLEIPNEDPDERWIDGFLNRPCMPHIHRTDTAWMLGSGIRVLSMQTGFALLEAGSVERSHVVDVMMKNIMDLILGPVSYWYLGYRMAFGVECWEEDKEEEIENKSTGVITKENVKVEMCGGWGSGFIGAITLDKPVPVREYANWFFQYSFAATSSTIVSGMIAERCTMLSYLLSSLFIVSVIYPIGSHWVWSEHGWLNALGFKDFAGGAVVHMVGAVAGFVYCKNIGNRMHWQHKSNHNPHNIIFGTIVLWIGWYGFNCGSTLGMASGLDLEAAKVALNTTLAASVAGTLAYLWAFFVRKDKITEYNLVSGGVLAGLVCVTPAADVVTPDLALVYGAVGFLAHVATDKVMEEIVQVDDVVKAMAVHGTPGFLGTLMIGIPGLTMGNCFTGDLEGTFKFEIQLLGLVAIIFSTIIVMQTWLLFLKFVCRVPLRCSEEYERIGRVDHLSRNRVKASTQIARMTARLASMELARRRDTERMKKLARKGKKGGKKSSKGSSSPKSPSGYQFPPPPPPGGDSSPGGESQDKKIAKKKKDKKREKDDGDSKKDGQGHDKKDSIINDNKSPDDGKSPTSEIQAQKLGGGVATKVSIVHQNGASATAASVGLTDQTQTQTQTHVLKLDEAVDLDEIAVAKDLDEIDLVDKIDEKPSLSAQKNVIGLASVSTAATGVTAVGKDVDGAVDPDLTPADDATNNKPLSNATIAGSLQVSSSGFLLRRGSSLTERGKELGVDEKEISRLQIEELEDLKKYGSAAEAKKQKGKKAAKEAKKVEKEAKKDGSKKGQQPEKKSMFSGWFGGKKKAGEAETVPGDKKSAGSDSVSGGGTKTETNSKDAPVTTSKKDDSIDPDDFHNGVKKKTRRKKSKTPESSSAEETSDSDDSEDSDSSSDLSFSEAELDVKELQQMKKDELKKLVEKEMEIRRNSLQGDVMGGIDMMMMQPM